MLLSLLWPLVRRRLIARYRGSLLGLFWLLLLPLLMAALLTLVFIHLLHIRWPTPRGEATPLEAALHLYLGYLLFQYLAENLTAAPHTILEHPNYVKRIPFPLPLLAVIPTLATLFPLAAGLFVAALLALFTPDARPLHLLLLPLYLLPLPLWALAAHWSLGALGVYLRDLSQLISPLTTVLLFLSPVFYPRSILPPPWPDLLLYNPLTIPIDAVRQLLFGPNLPSPALTLLNLLAASLALLLAHKLFRRLQPGFAEVL
ncbi:MAG: ABC transporter permease [Hydrogenophilus sp.]|nr:ABC transporter permease [Hydrogenophilus sp.]